MKTMLPLPLGRRFWVFSAVVGLTTAGNASPMSRLPYPQFYSQENVPNPFMVTAGPQKPEFDAGEPVALQIEVTNSSTQKADLQFSSGQSFDFTITKAGSKDVIWSWSGDKRFMQMMRTVTLEPGKSQKFEASWKNAAPGTYTVT